MWNKPSVPESPSTSTKPVPTTGHHPASSRSRVGAGMNVKGTFQGREDLVVEGRIEGKVELGQCSVVIEESGKIEGDVFARSIKVSGEVHGNLTAEEETVLLKTARLEGNIVAKRVSIEAGARFRGSIDMGSGAGVSRERVSPGPPPVRDRAESGSAVASKPNGSTERVGMG